MAKFRSTPPCRGRQEILHVQRRGGCVSIHAPVQGATSTVANRAGLDSPFRSTPPCRGRRYRRYSNMRCPHCFDPRPRAGGDLWKIMGSCPACCFDPRPRAGGDDPGIADRACRTVSIHAPVQGATGSLAPRRSKLGAFRSTPPCRGRRPNPNHIRRIMLVSIHAPVQGATDTHTEANAKLIVSIHAPVQGATVISAAGGYYYGVSIHAPVQGATNRRGGVSSGLASFDPRPRAGGDWLPIVAVQAAGRFDPRPRAGGDLNEILRHEISPSCFDPRPRAGGDRRRWPPTASSQSFDPRPRAGGDDDQAPEAPLGKFRSTPPCRGRQVTPIGGRLLMRFRSTPPCRGRPPMDNPHLHQGTFRSTPPCRGRREGRRKESRSRSGFDPRPRAGGDSIQQHPARQQATVSIHAPVQGATRRYYSHFFT